ncbi:MAG: hypothetical protein WB755_16415 [Terriglobales bacterium]
MSSQPIRRWDHETALLAWLTACVSIFSFLYYFRRGEVLLYGDAVAHINIARRVFDSRTPGLLQLGTVWLPLPHLLMIPFLLIKSMWQTGIGGSVPSIAAYVFGTIGIFRLVRGTLDSSSQPHTTARVAAWGAAIVYAANPNLIYLQATAMTESLYMALFIWAVLYFGEFVRESGKVEDNSQAAQASLIKCGLCLVGACLTRYDAWFLSGAMGLVAIFFGIKAKGPHPALARGLRNFLLLAAAAPVLWLAYNAIVYRNPLEFANGPYSAKAIEQRSPGATHPGNHDLPTAFSYFLKSAELNLAAGNWGRLWILLAVGGVLASLAAGKSFTSEGETPSGQPAGRRRYEPLLLLWIPLAFYPLSVAYGGVPIFMPVWWPFSFYNVRYGLELLPAFAVFATLEVFFLARWARERAARLALMATAFIVVAGSYASIWRDPVCFREAWVNSRTRIALERELSDYVRALPPDSTMLMYLGDHVGAFQQAGIPLRRVINEGNHRTWKQPDDPEGLWERALVNPAQYADFVIAFEGDAVSVGVQKQDLTPLAVIHVSGQPRATIYQTQAHAR